MKARPPVGILACSGIILIASFLPWGTLAVDLRDVFENATSEAFPGLRFPSMPISTAQAKVTAWNSHVSPFGMELPSWLVVLCGIGVGVIAVLGVTNKWQAPAALPIGLSTYGLLHSGYMIVVMANGGEVGIGSLATVVAFAALLTLTIRAASKAKASGEA